jgi:hypothetical protein
MDEDEQGDVLCMDKASDKCSTCNEWYCPAHFNGFMGMCGGCSEVEAVKYI